MKSEVCVDSFLITRQLVQIHLFHFMFLSLVQTEEKYQYYVSTLTERINTCDGILNQVKLAHCPIVNCWFINDFFIIW